MELPPGRALLASPPMSAMARPLTGVEGEAASVLAAEASRASLASQAREGAGA